MDVIPGLSIESDITLIGQATRIDGDVVFDRFTRIHGQIHGKVIGLKGSFIVVGETGSIHGKIECDEMVIDGFVRGNIEAKSKLTISESGKLIGDVIAPQFAVKFGAKFDGKAITRTKNAPDTSGQFAPNLEPNPSGA